MTIQEIASIYSSKPEMIQNWLDVHGLQVTDENLMAYVQQRNK